MTLDLIAERVKAARRALGLSQEQLAVKASVSRPTIARLETGRTADMGWKPLLRIVNAVGLDFRLTTLNRGRPTLEDIAQEQDA